MLTIIRNIFSPLACILFVLLLLCAGSSLIRAETDTSTFPVKGILTINCNPCKFEIIRNITPFSFYSKVDTLPDDQRVIESFRVSREDKPGWTQLLPVHKMLPVSTTDELFIGASDINFDGYNDLFFATSRGVANAYADYWLFNPSTQEFSYLGNYPIFTIDPSRQSLSTYERGGHGGMIYKKNRYRFINGSLTIVESEKQEATKKDGIYQRSIYRFKKGKLNLLKKEVVKALP